MKRFLYIFFAASFIVSAPFVLAADDEGFRKGDVITVARDEVINKDFFAFGERVEISGTVNGDVYAGAGQIIVDGTVNGDLLAGGGVIRVSGQVTQDARLAGGQVSINGRIGGSLTVAGGNVELSESASINGSLVGAGGNMTLASPIAGGIRVGGGNITISNTINGDVDAGVGFLRLTSNALITGDLNYWSDRDASIDPSARVIGNIAKHLTEGGAKATPLKAFALFAGASLILKIISFASTLILGILIIKLLPNFTTSTVETLRIKPLASLGIGLLGVVITPIVVVLLFITIVGLPLGMILLSLYFITLFVSRIFVTILVGKLIFDNFKRKTSLYWMLLVGLVSYYLVQIVPILGFLVTLLVVLAGVGSLLLSKKDTYLTARKKEVI